MEIVSKSTNQDKFKITSLDDATQIRLFKEPLPPAGTFISLFGLHGTQRAIHRFLNTNLAQIWHSSRLRNAKIIIFTLCDVI